jgi:nicotinate phosphoribosyltransferase
VIPTSALFTDFYELTMAQGYWKRGMKDIAVFDFFFRRQAFSGGYSVFAGLGSFLESLEAFHFDSGDMEYLEGLGIFEKDFLEYLAGFRFTGTVWAVGEGQLIFPLEPIVRIDADIVQAQIIEGLLLNCLNFQSLIATKSARVWRASGYGNIMEFGLRRAQGPDGAVSASRAAYIGGAKGTSNTLAGRLFGIPVMGTMAHSWVMSFPNELDAFEAYASIYPNATTFLIDTYDTMSSGIKNAITAGRKLIEQGKKFGVRLDSGDVDYLAREVRRELDEAGLKEAFIVVSNELDEDIIEHLVVNNAPVDTWGVGTHLVTGGKESSFTGVYKLAAVKRNGTFEPSMKFSDNPEKSTNPGVKQAYRLFDARGSALADYIALEGEEPRPGREILLNHPSGDWRQLRLVPDRIETLLIKVMEGGNRTCTLPDIATIRGGLRARMATFDSSYLRLLNPHLYKVSISQNLKDMKLSFINRHYKGTRL